MEEAVQTNPRGGAAGGRPPRQSLRAQVTAHAQVREAPPSTSGAWGRGGAWLVRGGALRKTRRLVHAAGVGGAEGAEARRGDVRSSWSRGLPPAADVRTVNNPERSVEGGGFPAVPGGAPLSSRRPSPSSGRWGGAGTSEGLASGRVGAISLGARRFCVCRTAEPGPVASLARSARSSRGDSRAARSARALRGAWAEPALLVPE